MHEDRLGIGNGACASTALHAKMIPMNDPEDEPIIFFNLDTGEFEQRTVDPTADRFLEVRQTT